MNKLSILLTQVKIHPLLWLVIALAVLTARFLEVIILLSIILIHELGHAAAATIFSWRIKHITLLPFGGVAEMDEHGNRPLIEEAIVILAGPLQHLWLIGGAFCFYQLSWLSGEHFSLFLSYNLMILLFNLLPIWPLDGGKLVFLLWSYLKPFPSAHRMTMYTSCLSMLLFTLFTIIYMPNNLNVWIILAFLLFSLYYEWKQHRFVFMRFLLERYYGKNSDVRMLRPLKVAEEELVVHVLERFCRGCKHPIIIEENGKEKGILDENEILHAIFAEKLLTAKIRDLLYSY
ncbi:site-2 protease family protein [Neobacillus sp. LXY-4]|uniref:site-2 protease family protein n=1 Tax=Neobacillus sp. LXY-4 TaxID=3379826 RepID=UPI003EE04E08